MATPVSVRGKILQAVITALEGITVAAGYNLTVNHVSTQFNISHPEEMAKNKLPACFPIDDTEDKEPFAISNGTDWEMKSVLKVFVTSIVYSRTGDTFTQRHKLIQDVEKAIVTNAALTALLLHAATPTTVETDKGYFGNYSVFDQVFECEYIYNQADGG